MSDYKDLVSRLRNDSYTTRLTWDNYYPIAFTEQVATAIETLVAERDGLLRWQETAVYNCAKRQCALRDKRLAEAEAERDEARKQLSELRRDVEEWCCEKCRMVYPGPPQPGVMCVICPQCGGATAPLVTVELLAALAERDGLRDNRFVLNRALAIAEADLESFGHHHAASAARAALCAGSDGKEGT